LAFNGAGFAALEFDPALVDLFPDWPDERFPFTLITHRAICRQPK
jgi:hypothetical protein